MYKDKDSKIELECIVCGKKFKVYPSQFEYGNPKYCSHECCYQHRKETDVLRREVITKKCKYCGKKIELTPSQIGRKKFCSVECADKYKSTLIGEDNPRYEPNKRVEKICEWCGEKFKILKSRLKREDRNDGKFCSRQCTAAWINRNRQNRVSKLEKGFAKNLRDEGLEFETQFPIKGFSIDIAFPEKEIAVEVDGEYWHSLPNVIEKDKRKDKRLKNKGWKVVHVRGKTIRNNLNKAINKVKEVL